MGPRATGRPYADADRAYLGALGGLALAALDRVALVDARMEKERLEEELRLARAIQERLLPRALPRVPGLDVAVCPAPAASSRATTTTSSRSLGGGVVVAVADVAGKGAGAALLMANVQAAVRLLRRARPPDPRRARRAHGPPQPAHRRQHGAGRVRHARVGRLGRPSPHVLQRRPPPAAARPRRRPRRGARRRRPAARRRRRGGLRGGHHRAQARRPRRALRRRPLGGAPGRGRRRGANGDRRLDALLVARRADTAQRILDAACADAAAFAGAPPVDDLTVMVLKATVPTGIARDGAAGAWRARGGRGADDVDARGERAGVQRERVRAGGKRAVVQQRHAAADGVERLDAHVRRPREREGEGGGPGGGVRDRRREGEAARAGPPSVASGSGVT